MSKKEINISNENYMAEFSLDNGVADYCKLYEIGGDEAGQIKYFEDQSKKIKQLEKALELMAKSVWSDGTSCMKFLDTGIQVNSQVEYLEYFKTKAKEMKSE